MLTEYLQAAMRRAKYQILPDDGSFYGEIPDFQGVYANAGTLESCREELQEVLEGWVLSRLQKPGFTGCRWAGVNNKEGRLMPHLGPIRRVDLIYLLAAARLRRSLCRR